MLQWRQGVSCRGPNGGVLTHFYLLHITPPLSPGVQIGAAGGPWFLYSQQSFFVCLQMIRALYFNLCSNLCSLVVGPVMISSFTSSSSRYCFVQSVQDLISRNYPCFIVILYSSSFIVFGQQRSAYRAKPSFFDVQIFNLIRLFS